MPARFTLIPALLGPLTRHHPRHHHHTHVYDSQNIKSGPFQLFLPIPLKGLGAQKPLGGTVWHWGFGLEHLPSGPGEGNGAWKGYMEPLRMLLKL